MHWLTRYDKNHFRARGRGFGTLGGVAQGCAEGNQAENVPRTTTYQNQQKSSIQLTITGLSYFY